MPEPLDDVTALATFQELLSVLEQDEPDTARLSDLACTASQTRYWAAVLLHALATACAEVILRLAPTPDGVAALVIGPGADETDPHIASGRILTAALNRDPDSVEAHVRVVVADFDVFTTVLADLCGTYHDAVHASLTGRDRS